MGATVAPMTDVPAATPAQPATVAIPPSQRPGANLGSTLARAARLNPSREAVIDGEIRFDYATLERRVAGLGGGLLGLGLQAGDVVAVLSLNSHRHLECWLGIPRVGLVLNELNFRLAPSELAFILTDCEAKALVVDDQFLDAGRELLEQCPSLEHLVHAADAPAEGTVAFEDLVASEAAPIADVAEDTLAGIFYTGGTTGRPKGVMLTHGNLLANAKHTIVAFEYAEDERYLHAGPMFHAADGCSTYAITWIGGTHAFVPAFAPEPFARVVEAERITSTLIVPTMIGMLVGDPVSDRTDFSSLRRILYGGSPMPAGLQKLARDKLDCTMTQAYGTTEASPLISVCPIRGDIEQEPWATRARSAGRPVVGVEAEIRRTDGSPAAVDEVGEIWIRGANVMAGYWRRPEETAAVLTEDGWYRTGDAGRMDADGYIYIVDRVKDMIVSGGENVYCAEVESALSSAPGVVEVAVFGVPDEQWGERVHAAIVHAEGGEPPVEDALVEHCRDVIAGYKLPRSFEFRTEPLPKSGAGKVLKRDLRAPHWEGRKEGVA